MDLSNDPAEVLHAGEGVDGEDQIDGIGPQERQVGEIAVGLAGKVIGQALSDDARIRATVDDFLTDLEQQAAR